MASPQDHMKSLVEAHKETLAKHTLKIKDKIYKIKPLNGEDGVDTLEFILQLVAPSMGSALDGMNHDSLMDGTPTTFSEVMMHLSRQLKGSTLKALSLALLEDLEVDGVKVSFSDQFQCNYGDWVKVVKFALQENYSSFFEDGWGSVMGDLMQMAAPLANQQVEPQPEH